MIRLDKAAIAEIKNHLGRRKEMTEALCARLGERKAIALNGFANATQLLMTLMNVAAGLERQDPVKGVMIQSVARQVLEEIHTIAMLIGASDEDLAAEEGEELGPALKAWSAELESSALRHLNDVDTLGRRVIR